MSAPYLTVLVVSAWCVTSGASSLPPMITFTFTKGSEKTFKGSEGTECKHGSGTNVPDEALIGDLALLSTEYQNNCWTDGRYSGQDWKVEKGTLDSSDGKSLVAYKVYPAAVKATQFQAGDKAIYIRSAKAGDVKMFSFDGTGFGKVTNKKVTTGVITVTQDVFAATGIAADDLKEPTIFLFDSDGARLSSWPLLSSAVEGAALASGTEFTLQARRFTLSQRPFVPESDWNVSPNGHSSNYGIPKKFFSVTRSDGKEGVVWRDEETSVVYMTWFATDLLSAETKQISTGKYHLVAAASNGADSIVLIKLSETKPADKAQGMDAKAIKIHSSTGAEILSKTLATAKADMNIYGHSSSGASMVWDIANNKIGLVLARTYTKAGDGLNHQGASAFIFDPDTLELASTPYGQTSGHSFANSLVLASDGTFLGMDLGDNYPRGINVWGFNSEGDKLGMHLVYAFKTKHGTKALSPAGKTYPQYTEISGGGTTYYKWSNDNNVYTEIAHEGVVEVDDGILVFFAGEKPPLDNSKVGAVMTEPRNMGFLKIGKDRSKKDILSSGEESAGGFYTFGGGWSDQSNKGVNFLTSYTTTDECVSRPKTARIAKGRNLLLWELWTKSAYVKSQAMVVDDDGAVVQQVFDMAYQLRLPVADNIVMVNGKAIAYAGTLEGHITRYEICSGETCSASTGPTAAPTPSGITAAPCQSGYVRMYGNSGISSCQPEGGAGGVVASVVPARSLSVLFLLSLAGVLWMF